LVRLSGLDGGPSTGILVAAADRWPSLRVEGDQVGGQCAADVSGDVIGEYFVGARFDAVEGMVRDGDGV
jgi:hypothetical protein